MNNCNSNLTLEDFKKCISAEDFEKYEKVSNPKAEPIQINLQLCLGDKKEVLNEIARLENMIHKLKNAIG
jgi:hypothetical protein